jgi:hypothetical protein
MKRIIKNYATLSPELRQLLTAEYPDGIAAKDIVSFRDVKGNRLHGVELKTEDTLYLIKVEGILERVAAAAEDGEDWEEPNDENDDWDGDDDSEGNSSRKNSRSESESESSSSNNESFDEDRHYYE